MTHRGIPKFSDLTLQEQREAVAELRLFVAMLMIHEAARGRRSRRRAVPAAPANNHRLLDLLPRDPSQH